MKKSGLKINKGCKLHKVLTFSMIFILFTEQILTVNADISAEQQMEYVKESVSYFEKYSMLKEETKSQETIKLSVDNAEMSKNRYAFLTELDSKKGILLNSENSWCEWDFEVKDDGVRTFEIEYAPLGTVGNINIEIAVDGKVPCSELKDYELKSVWRPTTDGKNRSFQKDNSGNEIRPGQKIVTQWTKTYLRDSQGIYSEPYMLKLGKGKHKVRITSKGSPIVIGELCFKNEKLISYEEYLKTVQSKGGEKEAFIQAEMPFATSSSSIYATYDKTNAFTVPNNPKVICMNTIGGSNWSEQGDYISWRVNVAEAGMYKLAFRARQNVNAGLISYRRLYINGETPFAEAKEIPFKYSQDWQMFVPGGDKPMLFYLKPGDILTLECTTGQVSEIIRDVKESLTKLNDEYRRIITITSVNPDIYQDYKLETKLPDLSEELLKISESLNRAYNRMQKLLNTKGSLASSIKSVVRSVKLFSEKPYSIPENLSLFKSNIESMGSLITSLSQQPLEIDYIGFIPENGEIPKANGSILTSLGFGIKQFIYSFTNDYSSLSGELNSDKKINVWVSTGRDQAQIIERLIASDFTVKTNVGVELNLVDTGTTLIRATLAGKGPDVALMIPSGTPVDLAARGALLPLDKYVTDSIYKNFHNSAWTPFRYNGQTYAMPESQVFPVIFYRKDILEQFGIKIPNTWEDFYNAMEIIQENNLAVGLPEIDANNMGVSSSLGIFAAFLMQNGCTSYYNNQLSATNFDNEIAFQAFTAWARLYTDYGLDRDVNIFSRFRTGEIPLAIRDLSDYVQIQQAAPEIRGLWGIAPIPGVEQKDGTVLRSEMSTVTGCIMLTAAKEHGVEQNAADFLSWWVSSDIQEKYGSELEISMGIAGRYFTANLSAFEKTNWSAAEFSALNSQLQFIINQPTVPGNYSVGRDLTSALREVISGENRPRRALMLYNTDINEEIKRKRIEFGLEN